MKGYVVCVWEKINSEEKLQEYALKAKIAADKYSGIFIIRGGKLKSFSGPNVVRTVIWEFPTYNDAMSCHESTEYKSAWTHADDTTKRIMFIVEGVEHQQIW